MAGPSRVHEATVTPASDRQWHGLTIRDLQPPHPRGGWTHSYQKAGWWATAWGTGHSSTERWWGQRGSPCLSQDPLLPQLCQV